MQPWQIRLSSDGRHPMFPTEPQLRGAVRVLAHTLGREAALFSIVDDHIHVVLHCERGMVTWRARSLCRVMRARAVTLIAPSYISPVQSRSHMQRLVGYTLNQTRHHDLPAHPALWTGSCFADLVGARALPGLEPKLAQALPRMKRWTLCKAVGLREQDLVPLEPGELRTLGAARILSAAAAVLAVGPNLEEAGRQRFLVRVLTAQVGASANVPREELAWVLGCTRRHIQRLEQAPIQETLLQMVCVRLAIEQAVARQQMQQRPPLML